jgi:hypothetical protein
MPWAIDGDGPHFENALGNFRRASLTRACAHAERPGSRVNHTTVKIALVLMAMTGVALIAMTGVAAADEPVRDDRIARLALASFAIVGDKKSDPLPVQAFFTVNLGWELVR